VTELTTSAFDLDDDGAAEVVADRPQRPVLSPLDGAAIAKAPAGGRMRMMSEAGEAARRDFLLMRKAGQPPVRLVLTQVPIFKALWALWQAKRIAGADDPGVTIAEVSGALAAADRPTATSSISRALLMMTKNEVVRSVEVRAGRRFAAKVYYPCSAGIEAFAMAEVLGDGSFVQVGRTARAWRRRDDGEPRNLFQHAALIRGWSDPAESVERA
jgi:hypothetical protein